MSLSDLLLDSMNCEPEPDEDDFGFMSVEEARSSIGGLAGLRGGGRHYRAVAAYVLDPANHVCGTPSQFFNFVTAYLSSGDFYTAAQLCRRALELYPYDVDLVAEALQAASGCGDFAQGARLVEHAGDIPKASWNWRLFLFAIEYYQTYLSACPPAERDAVFERGIALAHEYQRCLPTDERAYNKEAELLLYVNRREEAQRVLERAIFGKVTLPDGTAVSLVAPQCCVTMLDDVLGKSTDYQLIVKVARRGVRNTAQEQPSANIGYFVYREALALDAIVCDADDIREGFRNGDRVRDALVTYRCAYKLLEGRQKYRSTIEDRYAILCHKSGIEAPSLTGDGDE
jgi:tetratricopeptide (TPR) repeat protein